LVVDAKNPQDKQKLWRDFELYKTDKFELLDMRWIDDIKNATAVFGYVQGKKLYLHMDNIGMVIKSKRDNPDCNLMLDTDGYALRRYKNAYVDDYYWVRDQCFYNDNIYFTLTGNTTIVHIQ
jgi:hypothetical protein